MLFVLLDDVRAQSTNERLRAELLEMRERDQKAREECSKGKSDQQMKCYAAISETVDKPHTTRLNEIFRKFGFPNVAMVGSDGVQAFYIVLQHSPDVGLKNKCLKGITRAYKDKAISAMDYANFTDRLLVNLGKSQVYGSNFEFKDGKLVMSKTKDMKNLDRRRKKLGLMSIAEYATMLKELYKMDVVVPKKIKKARTKKPASAV